MELGRKEAICWGRWGALTSGDGENGGLIYILHEYFLVIKIHITFPPLLRTYLSQRNVSSMEQGLSLPPITLWSGSRIVPSTLQVLNNLHE